MIRLCWPLAALLAGCPAPAEKVAYETVNITKNIDCKGGVYNEGKITELQILTDNITIKRCKINGAIRTIGLGRNGEAPGIKASSTNLGHTERVQVAAPRNTVLFAVTIIGHGRIPLYLGPGTTHLTMYDSTIKGRSDSVALYLDTESGFNIIRNNTFDIISASREIIAVDGSASNHILTNTIKRAPNGGIYLYRNCGEGGTVRHQAPQKNLIVNNIINNTGGQGIWLGSRNGGRLYCSDDTGFPFGSSKNNNDFADNNTIKDNTFTGDANTIKDNGSNNKIN